MRRSSIQNPLADDTDDFDDADDAFDSTEFAEEDDEF